MTPNQLMARVHNGALYSIVASSFSILYYLTEVEVTTCKVNGLMVLSTMSMTRRKITFCCNEIFHILRRCIYNMAHFHLATNGPLIPQTDICAHDFNFLRETGRCSCACQLYLPIRSTVTSMNQIQFDIIHAFITSYRMILFHAVTLMFPARYCHFWKFYLLKFKY